jgi:hypothetical protein
MSASFPANTLLNQQQHLLPASTSIQHHHQPQVSNTGTSSTHTLWLSEFLKSARRLRRSRALYGRNLPGQGFFEEKMPKN